MIAFQATLRRPAENSGESWLFLKLPQEASDKLHSRAQVSVDGTLNGTPFQTSLQPDGEGGHWMKVKASLAEKANVSPGDTLDLEITPCEVEPEPEVPDDLQSALDAHPDSQPAWHKTTPLARRDWIAWITSGKKAETRIKRIDTAMDMLAKGKKRPCCFDRSGQYSNTMSCPLPADEK